MKTKSTQIVCFSPTKSTKKILETIASGIHSQPAETLDITLPSSLPENSVKIEADLAIIGVPVYGGRVPQIAIKRLQQLTADGVLAVIVVVYGNRGYDDALLELKDIAITQGFNPIAAGIFIAEHSFSLTQYPIAKSRPDADDLQKAKKFGNQIAKMLKANTIPSINAPLTVLGKSPYKERGKAAEFTPETDEHLCIKCKKCVEVCPTGAISEKDVTVTNPEKCILCKACVKVCENNARKANHPAFLAFAKRLNENCKTRMEPEFFM